MGKFYVICWILLKFRFWLHKKTFTHIMLVSVKKYEVISKLAPKTVRQTYLKWIVCILHHALQTCTYLFRSKNWNKGKLQCCTLDYPKFWIWEFFTKNIAWNSKHFIYIFKQLRPWSEGFYMSPLIWVWTVWKRYGFSIAGYRVERAGRYNMNHFPFYLLVKYCVWK